MGEEGGQGGQDKHRDEGSDSLLELTQTVNQTPYKGIKWTKYLPLIQVSGRVSGNIGVVRHVEDCVEQVKEIFCDTRHARDYK